MGGRVAVLLVAVLCGTLSFGALVCALAVCGDVWSVVVFNVVVGGSGVTCGVRLMVLADVLQMPVVLCVLKCVLLSVFK